MASFIFGGEGVPGNVREDICDIFEKRTGTEPAVSEQGDNLLVSSRDKIGQGDLKIAFNGYIVDNKIEPEKCVAEAYREYGPDFVEYLDGQFRLILYDTEKERFYASADKAGKKVIYYSNVKEGFRCSSHLKPLLRCSGIEPELNPRGISDFIQGWSASFGGGERLIKEVKRLHPSHFITYSNKGLSQKQFWDTGRKKRKLSDEEAAKRMDELLTEGAEKLVEQVEGSLNVFLSGGFDSTFLVALLREVTERPINTYTWGWEEEHFEAGRHMADKYGTAHTEIQNEYRFPTDEEISFYEEPQNAFVRYPFYELYKDHGLNHFWTGLNSQATFPVCLGNIRKLDRIRFMEPLFRKMPTERLKKVASKADYRAAKAIEVLESQNLSTAAVIDWSIRKDDAEDLLSQNMDSWKSLDSCLEDRWRPPQQSYQESYNYLQLRSRDTARYAYYAQDFEHYDVYGYTPLIEFSYSLPMSQKKNRRMLQKVARGRVPERIVTKGASGWSFVSKQFQKTIQANKTGYRQEIQDFIERGFLDKKAAQKILLPDRLEGQSTGQINQMIAVYLLERWIKQFVDQNKSFE